MTQTIDISDILTFGLEQTYTISDWWTDPGFTHISDTELKRKKMLELAISLSELANGSYHQSVDIWNHLQYEVFDSKGKAIFDVTMDPGSIEVKTHPSVFKEIEQIATLLVDGAHRAELVPFRNWWYGVRSGTEGGCHINMGGHTPQTNPFFLYPDLAIKYAAYLHNRPWLTYPFMGPDVGPEGNAMRMDEKENFSYLQNRFQQFTQNSNLSVEQVINFFADTNLVKEKASAPSLYKFKSPLYLIEDRAQESLRSVDDFLLVTSLRLKILNQLINQSAIEPLIHFENLHKKPLTSYWLWGKFISWANSLNVNPVNYQRFFDRQFPKLLLGNNMPQRFGIKEGRRPRVITGIQKRGEVVISKTIDIHYKRFELYYYTDIEEQFDFKVFAQGLEFESNTIRHESYLGFGNLGQAYYKYLDINYHDDNPIMEIKLFDRLLGIEIESAKFNLSDMMWC